MLEYNRSKELGTLKLSLKDRVLVKATLGIAVPVVKRMSKLLACIEVYTGSLPPSRAANPCLALEIWLTSSVTRKNRQMSIKVAQKCFH